MKSSPSSSNLILTGVVACFVLSGFAALLYQTAWMRQFSLVFGTSELAIAAVLSAYMGGLALGASVAAQFVNRITRPVLFYGLLEAGIALSALAVPFLLGLASFLYKGLLGGQPEPVDASGLGQSFFYLLVAFIVLVIPTAFMGATLPLLTKYVVNSKNQIGSRVGLLYATNTAGAIAGTLVAGFWLLPRLGLNGTVWVGVAVNLIVFLLAAQIAKNIGRVKTLPDSDRENSKDTIESVSDTKVSGETETAPSKRFLILPIMLLSGANSFVYEVLWTRLLGHILGGSIAAFATMLAGFLSGIAIGSAIASRFAKTPEQAVRYFVVAQVGIAATSIFIYQFLPLAIPETAGLGGNVIFAILVLLPATIFIGATFPLAVRIVATSEKDAAPASAKVYSWNTVGAIAGATLAAFLVIPLFKYEGTIKLAVLLNASLAFAAAFLAVNSVRATAAFSLVLIVGTVFFYHPKMPEEILRSSPVYPQAGGEIVFYEVGRSATVVVIEEGGLFYLRTNGLPEAAARVTGTPPARITQQHLSLLPVLARPDADSMLVIGFGGGVALETIPKSVSSVDVIELEPQVIQANQFYGERRQSNPLDDPRVNIIINDARSALSLTEKKYDAIVSQPSHPWTAGASHLYTLEFMSLAKEHLAEDGVFLQWMNASFVDEFLLRALSASMLEVFPYARMYQVSPGTVFFIGSEQPLDIERQMARTGLPLSDDVLTYLKLGVGAPEDLLVALTMDQESLERFSEGAPAITDDRNYMATVSARALDNGTSLNVNTLNDLTKDYDPLTAVESWIGSDFPTPIDYAYISRRLESQGSRLRALALNKRLYQEENDQAKIVNAIALQGLGNNEEAQTLLRSVLEIDPGNQYARYALLQPWFTDIFQGGELGRENLPVYVREELAKLDGSAADVFRGLWAVEARDMPALLDLDAELAAVLPTDLWYASSVKLRAEWRIQLTTPELQPRMYNEATELVDSAMALFLDVHLYTIRIRSTYLAGDLDSALVTASSLVNLLKSQVDNMEKGYRSKSELRLQTWLSQLDVVRGMVEEIVQETGGVESEMSSYLESIDSLINRIHGLLDQQQQ